MHCALLPACTTCFIALTMVVQGSHIVNCACLLSSSFAVQIPFLPAPHEICECALNARGCFSTLLSGDIGCPVDAVQTASQ